ncbi:MAG: hypothetical protein M1830_008848 [Pleopsidium flavum]|nr:MAG: hypothetical protein M1830_008848 [Pleopsidium flavum]
MSHLGRIGELTDELITVITGLASKQDAGKFRRWQDFAFQAIKQPSPRTNQFEVAARLKGLQEKFRVLNHDDLADALQDRIAEVEQISYKLAPEVLSLFLQLSDQPVKYSKVADLELLKPLDPPPPLTWSDILADDPLDDVEGVWSNIDFAADTSEDEDSVSTTDRSFQRLEVSSVSNKNDEDGALAQSYIVPEDDNALQEVTGAQFWISQVKLFREQAEGLHDMRELDGLWLITELQAVREVLFMLSGLPTSLFKREDPVIISLNTKYALHHSSEHSLHHILHSYAVTGTKLNRLRAWTVNKQDVPLTQTFTAATQQRLRSFNRSLSEMQGQFVAPQEEVVVSLLGIYSKVQLAAQPLLQLSEVVADLDVTCSAEPFRSLELLFDRASSNQASGDDEGFEFMAGLFFQCFETYLRPIRQWMNDGELGQHDRTFFVSMTKEKTESASLWSGQYHLLETAPGYLHAPNFLHTAAKRIFRIGKSVVFLKKLGAFEDRFNEEPAQEPQLNYKSICLSGSSTSLVPFSQLFDMAFDDWVNSKQHTSLSALRDRLYSQCGLWRSLDALEYIYFLKDGTLSSTIATTIFDKIDRGKGAWNDQFLLTELVQGVYGSLQCIDPENLAVRSAVGGYKDIQHRRRSVKILTCVLIEYDISWAVANIIKKSSTNTYQRIFTFLMQIRRAKHLLERQRLLTSRLPSLDSEDGENDHIYSLRLRLLWLTNTLYTYLTETVLAPSTVDMRKRMASAEDVDAMIAVHETYISHLEDQCLLSKKLAPIHQAIISLLDLTILFSDTQASYAGEKSFDLTNRSAISTVSTPASQRRRRPRNQSVSSSSSDDEDDKTEPNTSPIPTNEITYANKLRKLREQFDRLYGFVSAGLQAVGRTGGEPCWEMLAERLAWGNGARG